MWSSAIYEQLPLWVRADTNCGVVYFEANLVRLLTLIGCWGVYKDGGYIMTSIRDYAFGMKPSHIVGIMC